MLRTGRVIARNVEDVNIFEPNGSDRRRGGIRVVSRRKCESGIASIRSPAGNFEWLSRPRPIYLQADCLKGREVTL
jgi:hypothetical protein